VSAIMLQRVMMIAGETSGELHGSGVVRALRACRPSVDIYGIGGDRMRGEGADLTYHCSDLSFMGFVEVVRNLSTVLTVERTLEGLLETRRPDVVVLIDYPGFNLRFARKVKARGIPVLYYISPQVWAWNRRRVTRMRSLVDAMKVVFPFEVEIYRNEGINVEFVGHPIVERIGASMSREEFTGRFGLHPSRRIIGLLPGSRRQEIQKILPVMARAAMRLQEGRDLQIVLGVAPNLGPEAVREFLPHDLNVRLIEHATYDVMRYSDAMIVTSGTATLETGWFGTPMVIVYRTSPVSFFIGRLLVDVPYIGLVNIVAGSKVVPELLQGEMTEERIVRELRPLLDDRTEAAAMRRELEVIRSRLGSPGASDKVAAGIIALGERE
jgi:lipid-A-disaccharide synthase